MPAVRHIAVRLLGRRKRRPLQPNRAVLTNPDAPRTIAELSSRGLVVASSVGYGIHCIDVNGDLNLATAGLLDTAAAAVHTPEEPSGRAEPDLIILDLADVTFLDAVGVVALHRAYDLVRGRAEVRVDLPDHRGPRSMLQLAADQGWLAPVFRPDDTRAPSRPVRVTAR
jgi:hypothetical protein